MESLAEIFSLSMLGLVITALVVFIVYSIGRFMSNPKLLAWSKIEFFQIGISVALAILVLGLIQVSEMIEASQFTELLGEGREISGEGIFAISENYLKTIAKYNHQTIKAITYYGGSAEVLSRYGKQLCEPGIFMCVFGPNGKNYSPYSGFSFISQIMGVLLYSTTISYLTILAQIFFIKALSNGALLAYLPVALILRSMPFFRKLGGSIIAIVISLFIIFPFLLTFESLFWNPSDFGDPSQADNTFISSGAYTQPFSGSMLGDIWELVKSIAGKIFDMDGADLLKEPDEFFVDIFAEDREDVKNLALEYPSTFSYAASSFLSSVFLFSFNIIAIAASARWISRVIGEEVDLSRLMQII